MYSLCLDDQKASEIIRNLPLQSNFKFNASRRYRTSCSGSCEGKPWCSVSCVISVEFCEVCDHPMHVEPANRAESSWKGDVFLATLPLKHHGNHMFLAQVPFNSNLFFCAQQHCLLLAQMEAQRQHFGLARRGRWLRLRVTKHLVPSGDQPWLAGKPPIKMEVSMGNHRTKWGIFQHATIFLQLAWRICGVTLEDSRPGGSFSIHKCSKPVLVEYYMGLYYPIYWGLSQSIIGNPIDQQLSKIEENAT